MELNAQTPGNCGFLRAFLRRVLAMQHRIATHYIHTPRTRRQRSTGCRATMTAGLGIVWPLPGARAPSMARLGRLAPQLGDSERLD